MSQQNSQIRTDLDQLVSFPTDNRITLSRVLFLLHDVHALTANDVSTRDNITDVIQKLIEDDLDFDKLRDVTFELAAMSYWPEYTQRLEAQGGSTQLRYKYYQAFRHLYEKNNSYFSSIDYDPESKQFVVKSFTQEADFLQFGRLVEGYRRHVGFIHNDAERQQAKARMAEALHNSDLVVKIFN